MASSNIKGRPNAGGFSIPLKGKVVKSSKSATGSAYGVNNHANNQTGAARGYAKKS